MSTRSKGYDAYGLSKRRVKKLKEYCTSGKADVEIICRCANESNPDIARWIIRSVRLNLSYDKMMQEEEIPLMKIDFYGYRRKFFFLLNQELRSVAK